MTTAEDIEKAVEQLAPRELARFRAWFEVFDAEQFDAAIERDARTGKLDAHADEARTAPGVRASYKADAIRSKLNKTRAFQFAVVGSCGTLPPMKTKKLTEALERVEAWPPHAQNELAEFALELDAGFRDGEYEPAPEELADIDRGLRAAAEGRFASDREVEAVFAKFHGK